MSPQWCWPDDGRRMNACGELCGWLLYWKAADSASPQSGARCGSGKPCGWAGQVWYSAVLLSLRVEQHDCAVRCCYSFCAESAYSFWWYLLLLMWAVNEWMNEWMLFVAWWGWFLFCAPAALPALLLVSQQSLWEWSGERLLVAEIADYSLL